MVSAPRCPEGCGGSMQPSVGRGLATLAVSTASQGHAGLQSCTERASALLQVPGANASSGVGTPDSPPGGAAEAPTLPSSRPNQSIRRRHADSGFGTALLQYW